MGKLALHRNAGWAMIVVVAGNAGPGVGENKEARW
jgi:hypothetical protein